jgi:hypothetical protein
MKRHLFIIVCLLYSGSLLAQEKYPIPVRTGDQKHATAIYQLYGFMGAGINFAKAHGVTPYEYGKYLGTIFAPGWGPENNFDSFISGVIMHNELSRRPSDPAILVKENVDGSVSILSNEKIWHRYYGDNNNYASFSEFIEFINGLYQPIAERMGATMKSEVRDTLMVFTFKKK